MKAKELAYCGLLTSIILVFEVTAVLFGEAFVAITVLSSLPVYLLTKRQVKWGLLSYCVVALLLSILNFHQMLFFVFANGLIGLSLGLCNHWRLKKVLSPMITAIAAIVGLTVVSMTLGIDFFQLFGSSIVLNVLVLYALLVLYCSFYQWFANVIYKRIGNHMISR